MAETLGFGVGVVVFIAAIVLSVRRRAKLTPEQRQLEDQAREIRKLKRDARRAALD